MNQSQTKIQRIASKWTRRTAMLRKLALRKSQLEAMMGIRGSFGALSAYIGSRASKSENKASGRDFRRRASWSQGSRPQTFSLWVASTIKTL